MDKINRIYNDEDYKKYLDKIKVHEAERIFCGHDLAHFLDVARIAYIRNFELGLKYEKQVIYAIGLLHDIGRWCEYETEEPHNLASARLADEILTRAGYQSHDRRIIIEAIKEHGNKEMAKDEGLNGLIYRADKASRACSVCNEHAKCNWPDSKKKLSIEV